jgi:hypothetical protein
MRTNVIIPATQLRPGDVVLGHNAGGKQHRDEVLTKNTVLVGGRVSVLVARPTSKRHVRVLFNPQTALLVEREKVDQP